MIRVLLVDDDPIVLVQLRNLIDWNKLNCELVSEAANGADAIAAIEAFDPQLIITDISMPGINGIDLIQYIDRQEKKRKVIAISAYDDFDYVRKSLKGGATDYLLKHRLNAAVLENAINEALATIEDKEREESSGLSTRKRQEHLLYAALHSILSASEKEQLAELGLDWASGPLFLILCALPEQQQDEQSDIAYVLLDETIRFYQNYHILILEQGTFLILLSKTEEEDDTVSELALQLKNNMERIAGISMYYVVSGQMNHLDELPNILHRSVSILRDCRLKGIPGTIVSTSHEDSSDYVQKAIWYIQEHYHEKLTLSDIAEHLNVSASYLSRCFKKETGITVISYINQIRMKTARQMIDNGVLTLNEIAAEIGIQNYNYFYLMFKEVYGESPSDYMKKARTST